MRTFNHVGMVLQEKMEGMIYVEPLKVHITDFVFRARYSAPTAYAAAGSYSLCSPQYRGGYQRYKTSLWPIRYGTYAFGLCRGGGCGY